MCQDSCQAEKILRYMRSLTLRVREREMTLDNYVVIKKKNT